LTDDPDAVDWLYEMTVKAPASTTRTVSRK